MGQIVSNTSSAAAITAPLLPSSGIESLTASVDGFTTEQLIWASGYLAGLAGGVPETNAALPVTATQDEAQLTILYGSQTGNGRQVAEQLHAQSIAAGLSARLVNMADYRNHDLTKERWLALVVSTHGEGDAPDDAELLLEFIQSSRAPRLEELRFSVLALGDSSYQQFCQTGRDFEAGLLALGASVAVARIECDLDFEAPASQWSESALDAYQASVKASISSKVPLQVVSRTEQPSVTKDNPLLATVLTNQQITGDGSTKRVSHVELSLEESGLSYEPGDSLGVISKNPLPLVEEFLTELDAPADSVINRADKDLNLRDTLERDVEITANSGAFLQRYAQLSKAPELNDLLADAGARQDLIETHQVIDVIRRWPASYTAQEFIDTLRPLVPRLYSISSSVLATPNEVHLTVAEVQYEAFGTPHWGSASTFLSQTLEAGDSVEVYVEPNDRFRLPANPDSNVIMIGPGTGVAPFRSFVEHRVAEGASGENWLFFGDRTFANDFLYQLEWQRLLKQGALAGLDLAFSRDHAHKVYVQDKLREAGAKVYTWIEGGAHIYVCGDAKHMAIDVHTAILDILIEHGGHSEADAKSYLSRMKREKRYSRDVY